MVSYFTLIAAFFIFSLLSTEKAASQEPNPPQIDRYAPAAFDLPETIAGYHILAILTKNNFPCMKTGEKRLIVQIPALTIENGPRDFSTESIKNGLRATNLRQYAEERLIIVGPLLAREQLVSELEQSYRFLQLRECPQLQLPVHAKLQANADNKRSPPAAGFTIIQNTNITPDTLAQEVNLVAPPVPASQPLPFAGCKPDVVAIVAAAVAPAPNAPKPCSIHLAGGYSAFLNNGMTDKDYFLQVGFYFADGQGQVVWAASYAAAGELGPHSFRIPYVQGHEYYTTITFTSGVWWTCAADLADASSYRCAEHEGSAAGTHLVEDPFGTNIFAEDESLDPLYPTSGGPASPIQWIAKRARTSGNPPSYVWTSQKVYTFHACAISYPPALAIGGSLVNDGTAYFVTSNIPPYCGAI